MEDKEWIDLGPIQAFREGTLTEAAIGRAKIAVSHRNGQFGVVSGICNHAAGPLGKGRLDGDYIVCPWHNWKFHRVTGGGEPGYEDDAVPRYELRVEDGRLRVRGEPATGRHKRPHERHPLARPVRRETGPIRVAGLSTAVMDAANPRYSTSDALLEIERSPLSAL
jgi:nitrite reductase/ring-hydroxylating ferredoxin subunit